MDLLENKRYLAVIEKLLSAFPHWDELNGKTFLISGASGMVGSVLVDALMLRNRFLKKEDYCRVIAVGRNEELANKRFVSWLDCDEYQFLAHDISLPIEKMGWNPDYLIHAASTTHPKAYSAEPINTILANILGTQNLLEIAAKNPNSRFLLLSSVEIYGENRGDTEYFKEDYFGYLDCNTMRAGYPEGKRVSEALCQAYIQEKGVNAKVVRLPRSYGPTMRLSDTKAISQFIKKGANGENIVLKSEGNQLYSYLHTVDDVLAILWALLRGKSGEAYNAGDISSDITLRELAEIIAEHVGTKVIFELPDEMERKGYSTATKALLDASKLKALGWRPIYDLRTGIFETIAIFREIYGKI